MLNTGASDWIAPRVPRVSPDMWVPTVLSDWKRHKTSLRSLVLSEGMIEAEAPQKRAHSEPPIDFEQFKRNREVGRALLRWLEEDPEPDLEKEAEFKMLLDSIRHDFD